MGRVAVVGGSADYTGAPFFSAMASARLGADMSHVVCEAQAAQAIKTYSPNLMVHPLLRLSALAAPGESAETLAAAVVALLPRLHVLVVGPGLGRDRLMLDTCAAVIGAARARNVPLVLDADALLLAQTRPELVQGYRECVLTPNAAEFARLCASKGIADEVAALAEGERAARLARAFGGVLVVQKGPTDYISDGATTLAGDAQGCPKRSGGQGDTLTGCIATFLAWRRAYLDEIWDHAGDLDAAALLRLAAFGGSSVTRVGAPRLRSPAPAD